MKYALMLGMKCTSIVILFGVQLALARILSIGDFGRYSYFISISTVASICLIWGFDRLVLKLGSIEIAEANQLGFKQFLNNVYAATMFNALILLVAYLLIVYLLNVSFKYEGAGFALIVAFFVAIARISNTGTKCFNRVLTADMHINVVRPVVFIGLVFLCFLALDNVSYLECLVIYGASFAISFFLSWFYNMTLLSRHSIPIDISVSNQVFLIHRESSYFFLVSLGLPLLSNLDLIILGYFQDAKSISLYAIASRVTGLVLIGLVSANLIIAPKISVLFKTKKLKELQYMVQINNVFILLVSVVPISLLFFYSNGILAMFGEEYVDAAVLVKILILAQLVNVACGPVVLLTSLCGEQVKTAATMLAGCLLLTICCYYSIPKYGAVGAACSSVLSYCMINIYLVKIVKSEIGIDPSFLNLVSWK